MTRRHTTPDDAIEDLKRQLAELRATNRQLTDFACSVAHDLRNPLTQILCSAGLFSTLPAIATNPVAIQLANQLLAGAKKMQVLVDDYLAFFKTERHALRRQPVSLDALVELVRHELQPLTADRKVRWKVSPLPNVEGDPTMLRQAILNILSNALKFTRPRSEAVIEIGARSEPGESVIHFRDNGIGFDSSGAAALFHKFQRLHADQGFEGVGVGLVIVHHIAQRHGGKVWAEGEPNKGATFYLSLPA